MHLEMANGDIHLPGACTGTHNTPHLKRLHQRRPQGAKEGVIIHGGVHHQYHMRPHIRVWWRSLIWVHILHCLCRQLWVRLHGMAWLVLVNTSKRASCVCQHPSPDLTMLHDNMFHMLHAWWRGLGGIDTCQWLPTEQVGKGHSPRGQGRPERQGARWFHCRRCIATRAWPDLSEVKRAIHHHRVIHTNPPGRNLNPPCSRDEGRPNTLCSALVPGAAVEVVMMNFC